jgi:hypothetical protein
MPSLLCTVFDVVDKIPQLYDKDDDVYAPLTLVNMRNVILESDGRLRSALRRWYGTDLTSGITPWAKIPERKRLGRFSDANDNTSDAELLPWITVGASAITELWTLTFTSTTAYTITGAISGSQGTGSTSSDSASTNGYITVPSANWSGTPANNDVYWVRVYDVEAQIVELSSLLAASAILADNTTEYVPNQSEASLGYLARARAILKALTTRSRIRSWRSESPPGTLAQSRCNRACGLTNTAKI